MSENHHDNDRTNTHVVLTEGTIVRRYRIVEKIGAGGMGEVYLAQDTELDRTVALKFLSPHLCQDDDCRARFKREAQAAAKLDPPNIVTVYEVGEYCGRPFFAMQHVEGQSLKEFSSEKELPVDRILELAIQICEGLHEAHEKGVTHRDIKPSNILVDAHGRAKIVDFGLASVVGTDHLTKTGSTLGTIGYMSPEQVQGKDIDHRSDLFSLGVVLYELITQQSPFKRGSDAATLKAVSDDTPHPVARYRADVPDGIQTVIDKALEKDVKTRYQHADGMQSDLMRVKRSLDSDQSMESVPRWGRRSSRVYLLTGIIIAIVAVLALIITKPWVTDTVSDTPDKVMLAVLPFENLGDPEDEYFAAGITDEITSRLAMVHGFGVISRTSASAYKNSDKTLPLIARELGVDYILEGTIRWDKAGDTDRVRITPQLISVSDDLHIWANNYEQNLAKIFDVQVDIATQIVEALGITLAAEEQQLIDMKSTTDIDAYNYYLQGREYWDQKKIDLAISLLEQAVESDPGFAKAYSLLARIHGFSYFNMLDRSLRRQQECEVAARNAIRFSDGGIEGDIAMGYYYYYVEQDYDLALDKFETVLKRQPSNGDVLMATGFVQRRKGRWRAAADNLSKALEIDPHSEGLAAELATTLQCMREYDELIRVLDKSLSLAPDDPNLLFYKASALLGVGEDTGKVRAVLDRAMEYGDHGLTGFWMEGFDILFRDYGAAINRRTEPGSFILADSIEYYLGKADIYRYWGRDSLSLVYYDSARIIAERRLRTDSSMIFYHAILGVAYAGLDRKRDAIREGMVAVEAFPIAEDALYGPGMFEVLGQIYIMTGEFESAIDIVDSLMRIPAGIGIYDLRHHPKWDPLRDHPRFKALIDKYGKEYGI
ncbi:MAG: protein kinase [Candidatus Thorarchaeota archaeon]